MKERRTLRGCGSLGRDPGTALGMTADRGSLGRDPGTALGMTGGIT
jgi:hypothetical protein